VLVLDTARQLSGHHDVKDGGDSRLDVAIHTALTVAAAALARGDRAGLLTFAGDAQTWLPSVEGVGQLRRMALSLFDAQASAEEAGYDQMARLLTLRQKRRALLCILTDVVDEPGARALASAIAVLKGRHVPLVVALSDPALARLANSAADALEQRAAQLLVEHRRRALSALQSAGAIVVDAPAPRAAALAVRAYADAKALGRL
jgi:uncharacterized protein (DUF58 family)